MRKTLLDRYTAPNESFVLVARLGEEPYSGPRRAERAKQTLANQPRAFTSQGDQGRSPWLLTAIAGLTVRW